MKREAEAAPGSPRDEVVHATRPTLEFGPFRVDVVSGQLLREGRAIPLRPKTWAVLVHLVGRRGALVAREELLDAVWRDAVVCDDNLTQSIAEIRRALGEDSREPRFLETVRGRGFRFRTEPSPAPARPAASTPQGREHELVGREAELERLIALACAAARGSRGVVFVTGEPGMGKTSLVEAFLGRLGEGDDLWVARGQSIEQYGACEPYMPVLEGLQRLARRPDAARLVEVVRRVAPSWAAEIEPGAGGAAPRPELTPARMLREMANALEELTQDRTLVLFLEDLHWADPSTVDLLGLLARRQDPARLLVVGTYRPAEAAVKDHPIAMTKAALEARGRCVQIPLEDLAPRDVAAFLRLRHGDRPDVERLGRWLHRRSEGNPLFMVALTERLIGPRLARGEPVDERTLDEAEIPGDLVALIETQLARVGPMLRRLLEAGSIVGAAFDAQAVAVALGIDLPETEEACARLVHTHGLLVEDAVLEWPDGTVGGRYAFRHALYRQFLLDRVAPATARAIHRAVAGRLEAAWGDRSPEIAADLALHFGLAGERLRAALYDAHAGRRALGRGAFREARDRFETALAHLRPLAGSPERDRLELEILQPLAGILAGESFYCAAELEGTLERAEALAERLGEASAFFDACYARWYFLAVRGDADGARRMVERLDGLASTGAQRIVADNAACETVIWNGDDLERARLLGERVLAAEGTEAAAELEASPPFGIDPIVGAGVHLGWALWLLGFPDRAVEIERRVIARAERLGRPFTLTQALGQQSVLHHGCGRGELAERFGERARSAALEYGLDAWARIAEADRCAGRIRTTGDPRELAALRRAIDDYFATGSKICTPHDMFYVEACLALGESASGLAAAREAIARAERSFDRLFLAEILRLEGELVLAAAASGVPGAPLGADAEREARRCFEAALARARAQKARIFELRALTSLARLERRKGARAALRAELADLHGRFTEGFELEEFRLAKRLIDGR